MWAGRPGTWLCLLLAAGTCGCGQLETLRQGAGSTYRQELRALARDINRQEVENIAASKEWEPELHAATAAAKEDDGVVTANLWHPVPLEDAVTLRPPVAVEGGWTPR
jgi:hypothetical protein